MRVMDIDDEGLDTTDRRLLAAIIQKFASGPVGGAGVAAVIGEEVETIEDVYEPYLLQLGFLDRTPQGRVATDAARQHLAGLGYEIRRRAARSRTAVALRIRPPGRGTEPPRMPGGASFKVLVGSGQPVTQRMTPRDCRQEHRSSHAPRLADRSQRCRVRRRPGRWPERSLVADTRPTSHRGFAAHGSRV